MLPVNVFVSARGNAFMTDIAIWLVEGSRQAGREALLVQDRLPVAGDHINLVVAPHEFFVLHGGTDADLRTAVAASIPICTEQPGTPWYHLSLGYCRQSKIVLDINPHGVQALLADGLPARRLPLGGVPSMDRGSAHRPIDVLFLGGKTDRRSARLASLAPSLWERDTDLRLFQFTRPVLDGVPGLVFGSDKYELLGSSKILLNLHRDGVEPGYFEWARMVEAMAAGCAVVTEPSTGFEPLEPGVHFIQTTEIAAAIDELLEQPDRCVALGDAARRAVLDEYPLAASLAPLLEEIEAAPRVGGSPRRWLGLRGPEPLVRSHRPPLLPPFRPADTLRSRTYHALLAEQRLQRDIDRARCQLRHGIDDLVERRESAAYAKAETDVTVIVTLYNYSDLVDETLESIAASNGVSYEVVIVDDHSSDTGRSVVDAFMDRHDDVPILRLGSEINRGLAASRNLAFEHARASKVMVMDADNLVYPNCLQRLSAALDADPGAAFAYATLEDFGVSPGVRSAMGWYVPWLCDANYIDAQAMLRRSTWERHGGYRIGDDLVYGWEDYELWLRLADAGERGVHVPQMLGRYRTQASSMISITNLVEADIRAHLRTLHPQLPWPPT